MLKLRLKYTEQFGHCFEIVEEQSGHVRGKIESRAGGACSFHLLSNCYGIGGEPSAIFDLVDNLFVGDQLNPARVIPVEGFSTRLSFPWKFLFYLAGGMAVSTVFTKDPRVSEVGSFESAAHPERPTKLWAIRTNWSKK